MADPLPARRRRFDAAGLLRLLVAIAIVLLSVRLDSGSAGYDIDPSWSAVLSWGWTHSAAWGRELIFSYGPYGFLSPLFSYDPALLQTARVGQLGYAVLYSVVAALALRAASITVLLGLLLTLLLYAACWPGDAMWLLGYPLAWLALRRQAPRPLRWQLIGAIVIGITCAVPGLVKFSNMPLWLGWMLACMALPQTRQSGCVAVVASVATGLALWLLAGQPLTGIVDYLQTSLQITAGYADAMQVPPHVASTDLMVLAAVLVALLLLVVSSVRSAASLRERLVWFCLCALVLAIAFRISMVRADLTHRIVLFPVLAWLGLIAAAWSPQRQARVAGVAAVAASVALYFGIAEPDMIDAERAAAVRGQTAWQAAAHALEAGFDGDGLRARLDAQREASRRELALPRLRERIGNDAVDIFPAAQGQLFANDLHYRPRPAFQSYLVYSAALAEANLHHLASPQAAPWALLLLHGIDQRLLTSEDGLSLRYLFQHYRLVDDEQKWLLFERADDVRATAESWSADQALRFGEWMALPATADAGLSVAIDVRPDLAGRLSSLIWRAPRLFVELKLDSGELHRQRLVPAMARMGVLMSPWLPDNAALAAWLGGAAGARVVALRLVADDEAAVLGYQPEATLRWSSFHPLPAAPKPAATAQP